jgi:hypothetical protein
MMETPGVLTKTTMEPEEGLARPNEDDDRAGGRFTDLTKTTTKPEEGLAT